MRKKKGLQLITDREYAFEFSDDDSLRHFNAIIRFLLNRQRQRLSREEAEMLRNHPTIDAFVANALRFPEIHAELHNKYHVTSVLHPNVPSFNPAFQTGPPPPMQSVLAVSACGLRNKGPKVWTERDMRLVVTHLGIYCVHKGSGAGSDLPFDTIKMMYRSKKKNEVDLVLGSKDVWTLFNLSEDIVMFLQQAFCVHSYRKACVDFPLFTIRDTHELVNELSHFEMMDSDKDGEITKEEFARTLGKLFKPELAAALFNVFDANRDGSVSFPEYLHGMTVLQTNNEDDSDKIAFSFSLFDNDKSGCIDRNEFFTLVELVASTIHMPILEDESLRQFSDRMFNVIDKAQRGEITFEDYKRAMRESPEIAHMFPHFLRTRHAGKKKSVGKLVSMGDPNWHTTVSILNGLSLAAATCEFEGIGEVLEPFEFQRKVPYNLTRSYVKDGKHCAVIYDKSQHKGEMVFTDYCPQVFRGIRRICGIETSDYLWSLGSDQLVSSLLLGSFTAPTMLSSSGRSGAFFLGSHDGNYLIKTIHPAEGVALRRILEGYVQHLSRNPDSLLTRYYGLHALHYEGRKVVFVVMGSVLIAEKDINITYDLKGSTAGRSVPPEQRQGGVSLKDLDFNDDRGTISIEQETRDALLKQLRSDSQFLEHHKLIDYSFLMGIHNGRGHYTFDESDERSKRKSMRKSMRASVPVFAPSSQDGGDNQQPRRFTAPGAVAAGAPTSHDASNPQRDTNGHPHEGGAGGGARNEESGEWQGSEYGVTSGTSGVGVSGGLSLSSPRSTVWDDNDGPQVPLQIEPWDGFGDADEAVMDILRDMTEEEWRLYAPEPSNLERILSEPLYSPTRANNPNPGFPNRLGNATTNPTPTRVRVVSNPGTPTTPANNTQQSNSTPTPAAAGRRRVVVVAEPETAKPFGDFDGEDDEEGDSDITDSDESEPEEGLRRASALNEEAREELSNTFALLHRVRRASMHANKLMGSQHVRVADAGSPQAQNGMQAMASPPTRRVTRFQQHYGGMKALNNNEVYFIGIIDMLTEFDVKKVLEYRSKKIVSGDSMSCVPPIPYRSRFMHYMSSIIR